MQAKDNVLREFLTGERVANLINGYMYNGSRIVSADQVRPLETEISSVRRDGNHYETNKRSRDSVNLIHICETPGEVYLVFGIENQSTVNNIMPLRVMEYDAYTYRRQFQQLQSRRKESYRGHEQLMHDEVIRPVITLVCYWSAEPWDGPRSLYDMLDSDTMTYLAAHNLLNYVQDYRIHILEPAGLSEEELLHFGRELECVLGAIKCSDSAEKLQSFLDRKQPILSRDAVDVINVTTNSKIEYAEQEVIDMCRAIDDIRKESFDKGMTSGMLRGHAEGHAEALIQCLSALRASGMSVSEICKRLNLSVGEYARLMSPDDSE